jgi:hypothetical protein
MTEVARVLPDLMAELAALKAENAKLKAAKGGAMKITEKGGLSVYGLGRFPVTLYRSQWESLFARQGEIEAFIAANGDRLATKGEKAND